MLLPSIPIAFITDTPMKRNSNGQYQFYSLPIQSTKTEKDVDGMSMITSSKWEGIRSCLPREISWIIKKLPIYSTM